MASNEMGDDSQLEWKTSGGPGDASPEPISYLTGRAISPSSSQASSPTSGLRYKKKHIRRAVFSVIVANVGLPILIYAIFSNFTSSVIALSLSAIPPTVEAFLMILKKRKLDVIATIVVFSIVLSILVSLAADDARILLVKDSITTVVLGLGFLLSIVCLKEDLIWRCNRQLSDEDDALVQAELDAQWDQPSTRITSHILSLIWGAGLITEAVVRTVMIYSLPIHVMAYLSPLLMALFLVFLSAWSFVTLKARKFVPSSAQMISARLPEMRQQQQQLSTVMDPYSPPPSRPSTTPAPDPTTFTSSDPIEDAETEAQRILTAEQAATGHIDLYAVLNVTKEVGLPSASAILPLYLQ
ncbi:hypothetical protein HDU97_001066 [Phlyctochytrium planicorne]|nr:hypothetical protein HDU97_001066 [Phlyctochytrium planicorne]